MTEWSNLKANRPSSASTSTASSWRDELTKLPTLSHEPPPETVRAAVPHFEDLPTNLEIRDVEGKGRCLFTRTRISPGETIISTKPLVAVLDEANLSVRCSTCFRSTDGQAHSIKLFVCTVCRSIKYCSPACQKSDWKIHQQECKALVSYASAESRSRRRENGPSIPQTAIRAQARIVWSANAGDKSSWKVINSMISNRTTCSEKYKERMFRVCLALAAFLGEDLIASTFPSSTDLLDFCCRFAVNTFSLSDPFLSEIGVAVSPLLAMLNHTCQPNSAFLFPDYATAKNKKPMRVIATEAIEPGTEITTSYLAGALRGSKRREHLKEHYQFDCGCELCEIELTDDQYVDPRESLSCPDSKCDGLINIPKSHDGEVRNLHCSLCTKSRSVDLQLVKAAVEKAEEAYESLSSVPPTDHASFLTRLSSDLLSSFPFASSSSPLYSINVDLANAYLFDGSFALAASLSYSLANVVRILYKPGHPAIALSTLGLVKLLAATRSMELNDTQSIEEKRKAVENAQQILEWCKKAREEVQVSFGREGEGVVVQDLRAMMVDLEQEVQLRRADLMRR